MKLTTDKDEASRGLSATAELLVLVVSVCASFFVNVITLEPFDMSSLNFCGRKIMVKSSDDLENGCILMH